MQDIQTEADVQQLITTFYGQVTNDNLLKHHFEQIDWSAHLPAMISFWSLVLLGKEGYKNNTLEKHRHVALNKANIQRWATIFVSTVDSLFEGEISDKAKQHARIMQLTFESKLLSKD